MKKREHLWLWHVPYSFFILALRKEQDIGSDIAGLAETDRESSEGCRITLAKSSGWSHHKEDKTKGHSKPWIICCCHPTPSHNPSLCDSLFGSYVMNGRPQPALSIPVPQYSNNANILWPELSWVCLWKTAPSRWRGKGAQRRSAWVCPRVKIWNCSKIIFQCVSTVGSRTEMLLQHLQAA